MAIPLLALVMSLLSAGAASAQIPAACQNDLDSEAIIEHDLAPNVSFCELCDVGQVRIVIENPFRPPADVVGSIRNLIVTEDLGGSGLTYVPGSTNFSGIGIAVPANEEPSVAGPADSVLTWDLTGDVTLNDEPGFGNRDTLIIDFQVERDSSVDEEGLVSDPRDIEAFLNLEPECAPGETYSTSSGLGELPLREPDPEIIKRGRNLDAGQGPGQYSDPVYGHEGDDVIWRIEVRNNGNAPLQDVIFDDQMAPGNFEIDWVCDSEATATNASNGSPAGCIAPTTSTSVVGLDVAAEFGGGATPYIVAPPGGSGFYYLVGRVTSSCDDRTNSVLGFEWGCQEDAPAGGITQTSDGDSPGTDVAELSTLSDWDDLDVDVFLEGANRSQPMGARGTITIRIRNRTGGTIKHENGIRVRDLLPPQYVIDSSVDPQLLLAPAYGTAYEGMVDTLEWTNPQAGTSPMTSTNPADPLANTDLEFLLTSSTVNSEFPADQFNMIRHGDTVRIRFRTVLVDPTFYDKVADLDIRQEAPDSDPTPGTDPDEVSGDETFPISNFTEIWFQEFCTDTVERHLEFTDDDTAEPEDLDIDIAGTELVFILTNTGDPLPLSVELTNRGGHDANDYEAYVTFGEAMVVQTAPSGCSATANPPALPVWQTPTALPPTASVYRCQRGTISPGETETFDFTVVKNTAASFDDDLTFRADVIGEIHLADDVPQPGGGTGSWLWFPVPTARGDGITDRANNYSIDAVWARVVGYNLFKEQLGLCSENVVPVPADPDDQVQIGEECSFHIESGGWFGFRTPGFQYIAVQDIQVVDPIPDGQAYISSTNPLLQSTAAIMGVSLNPPPAPLDEGDFDWTFNTVVPPAVPDERITEKDHWFRVDVTTRLLNDPIDASNPPNEHAAISTNILTSTFQAVFFNDSTMMEEVYDLGPNTVGFPREVHRRVDLTVTEPEITVVKEVCNEGLYGSGASCTNWTTLADDGDAFDTYVFRIQVTNELADSGVTRAPAYDVTVTSEADASDRLEIIPLDSDGVDDDADGDIDGADADGEGTITDNVIDNGIPANVIASYTHSDALLRIDPGETVELYYRVDPDDNVAPLQLFTNTVSVGYDSLEGDSGSQSAPQGANGEIGGARQYELVDGAEASIQIIPVETTPKQITALANTPLSAPVTPQPVSVGEEIEFDLHALIPVAQLRQFVIRDELPPGLTCSEAPTIDLTTDAAYVAANFDPGGEVIPTCTDTVVEWDFGDQTVRNSDRTDRRFDFAVRFIARVDNILANQDGGILTNGAPTTVTEVRYIDEADSPQTIVIDEVSVLVQEPDIELQKSFAVAQADAADVLTVTVTATNNGNADAYNLRVLDDLAGVELSYVGNVSGTDPPTVDLTTFGPDSPLFTWAPGSGIAPTESVTFSFDVSLDGTVQPLEVLPNTIQADWTSLPGDDTALNSSGTIGAAGSATGMRNGALPNAGDTLNDYETEAEAEVSVPPLSIEKVDLDPALVPAIGAHKPFELVISLPEGTTQGLLATDDLASGAESYVLADNADFDVVYVFEGIASINGQPPSEAALTAVPADGTSGLAVWDIGTVVTDSEDDLTVAAIDPAIRITYHGRVENDLVTDRFDTLQNGVVVNYTNGDTGGQEALADDTPAIVTVEPELTATKALTNVTAGKAAGDPPQLGDTLQYVVTVPNGGDSTAHDVNIVDTLPPEVELFAGFTPTAEIDGTPVAGFVATPAGAPDGPLVWGRQNSGDESLDIPDGQSLVLTYQVSVNAVLPGTTIENEIWVDWTSLDGPDVHERTGDGCPAFTPPDDYCFGPAVAVGTADPLPAIGPLEKVNTQDSASIGEPFRWIIRVPETPYPYDLFDVEIRDDLTQPVSGAVLRVLNIAETSGTVPWTPVNNGTDDDLIIVGSGGGIDIAAGDQVELEITAVLEDDPANADGNPFTNTASFFYHLFDGDTTPLPGDSATTDPPMTVVEPDLTLTKSGPASMVIGTPETFRLDVENVGDGPAWNTTLTDVLPELPTAGGTCDTPPANISVERFDSGGASVAVLDSSSDYSTTWDPSPACLLTITVQSDVGTIGPGERLVVSYDAQLDSDTPDAASLTNIAGAVEWFSWEDTSPDRRTYTETVTDGTPAVVDFQDAFTVAATLPGLRFDKTVTNLTTSTSPATVATPGDLLEYELVITNVDGTPLDDFSIVDDLGSLNGTPVFEPNTLVVSTPSGTDQSDPVGGTHSTGRVEVSGLSLPALNDSVTITFQVQLASPLPNGTLVTNQSQILIDGVLFLESDDPDLNGPADPDVADDEDPTQLTIQSAPDFLTQKTSAYLTGDPTVLLAGETLRYTITVLNVGTEDAIDVTLRDPVPANTTYVPNSTTLNGNPVADVGGLSPLASGILLQPLGGGPAGAMPADPTADPDSVATIVFDVVVEPNAADGTVISNQAFVTTVPGGVIDDPSDDPDTPAPDDPTRDVVGDLPLLFASKDAALLDDTNGNGIVDAGDSLLYTITVFNSGAVDATNAALQDMVPANTSYRAGSTTLNAGAIGDPGPGLFPLAQAGGLPISSSDLTPPPPGPGAGTITSLQAATVTFILDVDPLAAPGTLISNQATVTSDEVPNLLTDGDGDPSTGPEPTIVVVGGGQTLSITKQVVVVGGGAVLPGSVLEYTVRVVNAGTEDATSVTLFDDLDADTPGLLTLVPGTATMNASTTGVMEAGNVVTADYSTSYGPLATGEAIVLRFQAVVMAGLMPGVRITNTGVVEWNAPTQTAMASVSVDVGGMPGVGVLNGAVWHDADFDDVQGVTERDLFGWSVELYRNGGLVQSSTTNASGAWSIAGLAPNDLSGDQYELRFRQPGAGSNTAALGRASSPFTNALQRISDIVVTSGANLQDLHLPIDPNGVVYDALLRAPLSGAALTLLNAGSGTPVSTGCLEDPIQQGQVTGADGYYKFDLVFGDLSCPVSGNYLIAVAPPGAGYTAGASQLIPPTTDATTLPLLVPSCPGGANDAVAAPAGYCEAQDSEFAPPPAISPGSAGTTYFLHLAFDDSGPPGSRQIFNNHIAVDPVLDGALAISKTTPSMNVSRGSLVPYQIVVTNDLGAPIPDLGILDTIPPGFQYVDGSARIDGVPDEPIRSGRELLWENVVIDANSSRTLVVLLAVGAGVSDGEYVNRAQAVSTATSLALSGEARATVRVVPDPTFACTDVMGKVFDDKNRNGAQDPGELGLGGVRVVTARGLVAATDQHGRYHFTCATIPNDHRGSNFILKLDDRSLPSGFRMSGGATQVKRATRGKALRFNFGASIHRVVSLDMADPVFEPGTTEMRPQWMPRLGLLIDELKKAPSVLRLSYVADVEDADLVEERLEEVKARITETWKSLEGETYPLTIEPEIYWRRGAPPAAPALRSREER